MSREAEEPRLGPRQGPKPSQISPPQITELTRSRFQIQTWSETAESSQAQAIPRPVSGNA